jgi:hypothetical protein
MSRNKLPVKLTKKQWDLVTEAVFEWGCLCDAEADIADGSRHKRLDKRSLALDKLASNIGRQVTKAEGQDVDPTPYCNACGAKRKSQCNCGPVADNE